MHARPHQAVFISDLHLHPDMPTITRRFEQFIQWAAESTSSVYILGDFFHVWPGDEALDEWSEHIADQLAWLSEQGVVVYLMVGNRDFLLGDRFFQRAKLIEMVEPCVIQLGEQSVLLVHGDRYCTRDITHQHLRRLTRNRWFKKGFLRLPYQLRSRIVNHVRAHSQMNTRKPMDRMAVVESAVIRHLRQQGVNTLIHGHTHQPGLTVHQDENSKYRRFVLSDWDEKPLIMCYNLSGDFLFERSGDVNG